MYDAQDKNYDKLIHGQRPEEHDEGSHTPPSEKAIVHLDDDATRLAAAAGHVATDEYGRPIVHLDPKAEAKLLWKLDLFVVPTVAVLYLFCFIDVRSSLLIE